MERELLRYNLEIELDGQMLDMGKYEHPCRTLIKNRPKIFNNIENKLYRKYTKE